MKFGKRHIERTPTLINLLDPDLAGCLLHIRAASLLNVPNMTDNYRPGCKIRPVYGWPDKLHRKLMYKKQDYIPHSLRLTIPNMLRENIIYSSTKRPSFVARLS